MAGLRVSSLPEDVAAYIRESILSGELRPGDFIRLEPIAEAVGVSNTPVREALLALRSEGFVELVPRRGFRVERLSRRDVEDVFWVQAQIAGELAARAAKQVSADDILGLKKSCEQYEAAVQSGDYHRIAETGHSFHRRINHAAESSRLAGILGSLAYLVPNRFYATVEGYVDHSGHDHREVVKALESRDPVRARDVMGRHIQELGRLLLEVLNERRLWDE